MTIIIVSIFLVGFLLIATERLNRMNSSAVAIFMGVVAWVLYVSMGSDYLAAQHAAEFQQFEATFTGAKSVKVFISQYVFLPYLMKAAETVLFLLCTMTIVEVLNNNGCFDFLQEWLYVRNPKKFLWLLMLFTALLSVNLDNLTTVCVMLSIMHALVATESLRRIYGVVIILSANLAGAITVIGDVTSLTLWQSGLITPTEYTSQIALPAMVGLVTTLLLFTLRLPARVGLKQSIIPYRGDDTTLNRWQRLLMLIVGLGGLWFIPTFHRITQLPPLVGAMCVLGVLWIVHELSNRLLISSDIMVRKRFPLVLQYANVQKMLFFFGLSLAFGALAETGVLTRLLETIPASLSNEYVYSAFSGLLAALFNGIAAILGNVAMLTAGSEGLASMFVANPDYWALLNFSVAMGSCLFCIGTLDGMYLMKMEHFSLGWYLKHCTWRILVGWLAGGFTFFLFS